MTAQPLEHANLPEPDSRWDASALLCGTMSIYRPTHDVVPNRGAAGRMAQDAQQRLDLARHMTNDDSPAVVRAACGAASDAVAAALLAQGKVMDDAPDERRSIEPRSMRLKNLFHSFDRLQAVAASDEQTALVGPDGARDAVEVAQEIIDLVSLFLRIYPFQLHRGCLPAQQRWDTRELLLGIVIIWPPVKYVIPSRRKAGQLLDDARRQLESALGMMDAHDAPAAFSYAFQAADAGLAAAMIIQGRVIREDDRGSGLHRSIEPASRWLTQLFTSFDHMRACLENAEDAGVAPPIFEGDAQAGVGTARDIVCVASQFIDVYPYQTTAGDEDLPFTVEFMKWVYSIGREVYFDGAEWTLSKWGATWHITRNGDDWQVVETAKWHEPKPSTMHDINFVEQEVMHLCAVAKYHQFEGARLKRQRYIERNNIITTDDSQD